MVKTELFYHSSDFGKDEKAWQNSIRKMLRKALQDNGTAHYERWIHVHLPSVDEHAVHPTGVVSLDVLLVVI